MHGRWEHVDLTYRGHPEGIDGHQATSDRQMTMHPEFRVIPAALWAWRAVRAPISTARMLATSMHQARGTESAAKVLGQGWMNGVVVPTGMKPRRSRIGRLSSDASVCR